MGLSVSIRAEREESRDLLFIEGVSSEVTDTKDDTSDTQKSDLAKFSGYYNLSGRRDGAFLIIDTIAHFNRGFPTLKLYVRINLDPKNDDAESYEFPRLATFNGRQLVIVDTSQHWDVHLTFSHKEATGEKAAICTGTIKIPKHEDGDDRWSGSTIFNPIPFSFFQGTYFQYSPDSFQYKPNYFQYKPIKPFIAQAVQVYSLRYYKSGKSGKSGLLEIYDHVGQKYILKYSYNYNCQKFYFTKDEKTTWLLMGFNEYTLTCVVLEENKGTLTPKENLVTIQFASSYKGGVINKESNMLAKYAGYYRISDAGDFVSITGRRTRRAGTERKSEAVTDTESDTGYTDTWQVDICKPIKLLNSVAVTASVYLFNTHMVLDIKEKEKEVTLTTIPIGKVNLTHEYTSSTGSFSTGSVFQLEGPGGTGYSMFNPVPLTNVGGVEGPPITTFSKGKLQLQVSESEIKYNGDVPIKEFEYVPVTRTLSFKQTGSSASETTFCNFRSDSGGIVCFVTVYDKNKNRIIQASELTADLPAASSG